MLRSWHNARVTFMRALLRSKWTRWLVVSLDRWGITFIRKGDEITWLWPWKRRNRDAKFLCSTAHGIYCTLQDIDNFWADYQNACMQFPEEPVKLRDLFE